MRNPLNLIHEGIQKVENKNLRRVLGAATWFTKWSVVAYTASALVGALSWPLPLIVAGGIIVWYAIKDEISAARKEDYKLLRRVPRAVEDVLGTGIESFSWWGEKIWKGLRWTKHQIIDLFNQKPNPSTSNPSTNSSSTSNPSTNSSSTSLQRAKNVIAKNALTKKSTASTNSSSTNNPSTPGYIAWDHFQIQKTVAKNPSWKLVLEWIGPVDTDIVFEHKWAIIWNSTTDSSWKFVLEIDDFRAQKRFINKDIQLSYKDTNWTKKSDDFKLTLPNH